MKAILSTILATAITTAAFAQSPDKALARVKYSFTHIQDTTQRDKPYTENMLLVIGKNASVYTSYDKLNSAIAMNQQLQEQIRNNAGGPQSISIKRTSSKPTNGLDYFFFVKENKFVTKERLFNNYLIEEEAPKISWKITKDTASFSGVHCQKATTHFKGRNWIAWYAPDMPFQSGPWKLNGLPGLIVEAYDEKKEVQFQFAGIDKVDETNVATTIEEKPISGNVVKVMGMDGADAYLGSEIKLPADALKTTQKELDKLKEARDKDPQGFLNAQLANSGIQGSFKMNTNTQMRPAGTAGPVKITINNPIELPEKK
ncbi:GLPGLI family protein [Pedobacter sp. KR3-3]|uniref:GLPGLI family protein n=1 Tax=Pedobacter albus TaxID=3113905 RepID=A0ABU7I3D5_9SPHI|nr:GLPGLI family protein [Pedobacter sp. KR3-3]MEE1943943.1 GLPGLI family protein [Pedobacter sp. KR3-3]